MDLYTVTDVVNYVTKQGTPCWQVSMLKPDGVIHGHIFPQSILEWRVAEYELDTPDEALDFVLHEPWATDLSDPSQLRDDAAVKAGLVVRRVSPFVDYEPIHLFSTQNVADVRSAHRIRITDAKARVSVVPPEHTSDPLDMIRENHGVTPDGIGVKQALVAKARRAHMGLPEKLSNRIIFDPEAKNHKR